MESAEILEVGALLELGDGCRDLIDDGQCPFPAPDIEILALDSLVRWVLLWRHVPTRR
jgi:hypothetical protein